MWALVSTVIGPKVAEWRGTRHQNITELKMSESRVNVYNTDVFQACNNVHDALCAGILIFIRSIQYVHVGCVLIHERG